MLSRQRLKLCDNHFYIFFSPVRSNFQCIKRANSPFHSKYFDCYRLKSSESKREKIESHESSSESWSQMLKKYHESEVEWNKIRLRALFIAIRVSCAAIYSSWTIKTQSDNISAILVVQSSSQFNYLLRNKTAIPSNIFWFHFEMCFCAHQIFSGENIGRISLSLSVIYLFLVSTVPYLWFVCVE